MRAIMLTFPMLQSVLVISLPNILNTLLMKFKAEGREKFGKLMIKIFQPLLNKDAADSKRIWSV